MKQKRILPLLLAAALLLSGCGQKEEAPADDAAGEEIAAQKQPQDGADPSPEDLAEDQVPEGQTPEDLPEEAHALTVSEAVNLLMSLPPSVLDLPGDTMSAYRVYPATEVVAVDEQPCSKLLVYEADQEIETNVIRGIYLLSRGAERRLYRLDQEDGTVMELALPIWAASG